MSVSVLAELGALRRDVAWIRKRMRRRRKSEGRGRKEERRNYGPSTIDPRGVNVAFVQRFGSCVCASYAVAASYLCRLTVQECFEGYCLHFGLRWASFEEAQQQFAVHFDSEWRRRNCRGYEVMLDLHCNSSVECFVKARQRMEGTFHLHADADFLETRLLHGDCFLNITFERSATEYHSVTIFSDGRYLFQRDTNQPEITLLRGLRDLGRLRDSVLYVATRAKDKSEKKKCKVSSSLGLLEQPVPH